MIIVGGELFPSPLAQDYAGGHAEEAAMQTWKRGQK
jgi:hypothetical protein